MYRASTNPPATAWARHLDAVMRKQDWSRVRLFEEVGTELGYAPKSRSAILPLLVDKEPTEAQARVLRKHFGEPPAETIPESTAAPDTDLAAALMAIAVELRTSREERESTDARLRAAESELRSLRAQLAAVVSPKRPALHETVG